jgi:sugar porter (SP) family MFS transporter
MFVVPESPRWLVKYGKKDAALRTLRKVGGENYAQQTLTEIQETLAQESRKISLKELLDHRLKKVLLIGIGLAVFQQWCGINVIFNYAEEIFSAAGYGVSDILFNIVVTGSVNLIFTFIAIFTVDRWGRRRLLLIGASGLAITYLFMGLSYLFHSSGLHVLLLVVAAIGIYAMSLAPVIWVVIAEIFPNRIRGTAMSVAVSSLWMACFLLTYSFPYLNRGLGAAGTFWIYCTICVIGFVFIHRLLPETKGKSLEEIEKDLLA